MRLHCILSVLALVSSRAVFVGAAVPPIRQDQSTQHPLSAPIQHRPLVIWHGLGDTALSEGIAGFIEDIKAQYPGIFVYSVQIPKGGSLDAERKAGFFGKMEEQVQDGCEQLGGIPELAGGFDAMGFSQGGLYLRSYAQFCNDPPVRNLITFGTPHYGISALLPCPTPPTLQCRLAARAAQSGIYTQWAQNHLVQAQYFRDVERLAEYGEVNTFLTRLNNETLPTPKSERSDAQSSALVSQTKGKGTGRLEGLENFVAMMFDADKTVSPAQSAHFWTYTPGNKTLLLPLASQPLYTQDWIGLRDLDERGRLHLGHCVGEHMDLDSGGCAQGVVDKWVGGRV
ncbi:palmitoyl-protein thioesterase [Dioszegia hungarica]|uniref:Palmitoyl-protein thioesterase 1 n=1 Tax=Dioszegia hungarica TaxID=4972 RepID=A0AA38HFT3_9TREE|nr:palmitoyl-protein thioesterase [Dioszegia hungarica]KAI9639561.1 palmitoyl-protein thioesterase [Dioszegia hungarica]